MGLKSPKLIKFIGKVYLFDKIEFFSLQNPILLNESSNWLFLAFYCRIKLGRRALEGFTASCIHGFPPSGKFCYKIYGLSSRRQLLISWALIILLRAFIIIQVDLVVDIIRIPLVDLCELLPKEALIDQLVCLLPIFVLRI